jgi:GNAT superfamily N-acetyltransferase
MDIRALGPGDLDDWLAFFDGPAWSDNPEWSQCYCRAYLIPDPDATWDAACDAGANREPMCAAIRNGKVDGMLARVDGKVVGWLHVGPVTRFNYAARFHDTADREPDVGAIVCLLVSAPVRGHGIARALLRAALDALRDRGFRRVRAWPRTDESEGSAMSLFHGPRALYLSEGFEPVGPRGHLTVMERALP